MYHLVTLQEVAGAVPYSSWATASSLTTQKLTGEQQTEVLAFLAVRPLHTVLLASLIRDNGLVSHLNRGTFYGCRNNEGQLEGVALIGHATVIETQSEAALQCFARLAQDCSAAHVIAGEQEKIEYFWHKYAGAGKTARRLCREQLLEQRWPVEAHEPMRELRRATLDELELVMPVQAQMAFDESGVNPMNSDPTGFRLRCARRIEQGRTWVLVENGRLIFKAEIVAATPEASYVEGVYVDPEERGKGYGLRCMAQLGRNLLESTESISILVNEQNQQALRFYRKCGYEFQCFYDTIYLQQSH